MHYMYIVTFCKLVLFTKTGQLNIIDKQPSEGDNIEDNLYKKNGESGFKSEVNYVYAKQGKSNNYHIWYLRDLLKSNDQLLEVGDKVLNDKSRFNVTLNQLSRIAISIKIQNNK